MAIKPKTDIRITDKFEPEVFWQRHGSKVVLAVVAIVLIGGGLFIRQRKAVEDAERAASLLAEANDISSLQEVARDFAGKEQAAQALIRLAEIHYREGRHGDAAGAYQRFLEAFPKHPLVESALLGIAAVEEAQGNFESAFARYTRLFADYPNGYTAVAARMGAARCAEATGRTREARQLYEELMVIAQGTPWFSEAYMRWVVLGRETIREPVLQLPVEDAPAEPLEPGDIPAEQALPEQ